jgi:hypothetical protein
MVMFIELDDAMTPASSLRPFAVKRWLSHSSIKRINTKAPSKAGNTEIAAGQGFLRNELFVPYIVTQPR